MLADFITEFDVLYKRRNGDGFIRRSDRGTEEAAEVRDLRILALSIDAKIKIAICYIYHKAVCRSEKAELGPLAAGKIEQLTSELQALCGDNPIERVKIGFQHFKKEKYE
ncbi:hypothetical protein ACLOJK_032474 [Asimina triloba]